MSGPEHPRNTLEQAIAAFADAGEDPEAAARGQVFACLAAGTLALLSSDPPSADGRPASGSRPMLVSDGPDTGQPMLAVFSTRERAEAFHRTEGGYEYPVEVPGLWAVLATPAESGIVVNPNQSLAFRIPPHVAALLREDAAATLSEAQTRQPRGES